MSHGHCGILDSEGYVQNDPTLPLLTQTAVSHALAGADMVAPSDMMDGRVAAIRKGLDEQGLTDIPVLSYAVNMPLPFMVLSVMPLNLLLPTVIANPIRWMPVMAVRL